MGKDVMPVTANVYRQKSITFVQSAFERSPARRRVRTDDLAMALS